MILTRREFIFSREGESCACAPPRLRRPTVQSSPPWHDVCIMHESRQPDTRMARCAGTIVARPDGLTPEGRQAEGGGGGRIGCVYPPGGYRRQPLPLGSRSLLHLRGGFYLWEGARVRLMAPPIHSWLWHDLTTPIKSTVRRQVGRHFGLGWLIGRFPQAVALS